MAAQAIIHHHLDLMIRLLDSTTGRAIPSRDVQFRQEPLRGRPIGRDDGTYLFLGIGKEDFTMEVSVHGYEPREVKISFEQLDQLTPIQEIYLLPKDYPAGGNEVLALRGNLPGIQAVEAVWLGGADCCIREFDARRKIMKILNPHNVRLPHIRYGLISQDRTVFEGFEIAQEISLTEIRLKEPLTSAYVINQPIARIIPGQVGKDGNYMLKVKSSREAVYLVRYVVDGEERYQKVDFNQPEKELQ